MALDVLRVRPIDTDMHTFPRAMAASRTFRTTPMSVPVLVLFPRSHLHSPEARCGGMERVPSGLQFMRSPLGAVPMISGATAKEMRVSSVNLARVLSSNSRLSALNSLSSINRTCLMVFPRSAGHSIPLYRYIRSFRFLCGAPQLMHTAKQGILHSTHPNHYIGELRALRIFADFLHLWPSSIHDAGGKRETGCCERVRSRPFSIGVLRSQSWAHHA